MAIPSLTVRKLLNSAKISANMTTVTIILSVAPVKEASVSSA